MDEPTPETMRDQLLALEAITPSLRAQYEKKVQALLERRLSPFRRGVGWLGVGFSLVLIGSVLVRAAGWGVPLGTAPELAVTAALVLLGLTAVVAYTLWRGSIHVLREEPWVETVGGIGMAALAAVVLWLAWQVDDPAASLQGTAVGMILLGGMAVNLLLSIQRRHHRETKAKLLELELYLAELTEKLAQFEKDAG